MGFNFSTYIAQFCVAFALLIIIVSINLDGFSALIDGFEIPKESMVKLNVNIILFVFAASIFLIPSLKSNVVKLINKPFDYSNKLLDKFMK